MPNDSIKVTVQVEGQRKRLFTLRERSNGDLHISLHHAAHIRGMGEVISMEEPKILHQHYSVHRSVNSANDINLIKHTIKLSNGEEITTPIYTRAIKQTGRYASLYTSRSTSLRAESYNLRDKEGISLGSFDPTQATLFHMLVVSGRSKTDQLKDQFDLSVATWNFSYFNVTALWSFAILPAWDAGAKIHNMTVDGLDDEFDENMPMDGYEDEVLLAIYRSNISALRAEAIQLIGRECPDLIPDLERLRRLGFLKSCPPTRTAVD